SLRARLPNDSLPGRRRTPGVRAGRRAGRRRPRQRRVWALQRVNTRVRTSGAHERAGSVRALVWTRVAGVRRAHHTAHRVQPRVRVQGIYRGECDASGRVGQAFAGRRHSKICPRAAEPRRNGDDPAAAHAHERLARLHPIARVAGPRGARHVSARDALNVLERQRALNFEPGTAFAYSNTGYFLLGLVVQRVSGESLPQFAREHIFEPLGMQDTRYVDDTRDVVPRRAVAYERAPNGTWREAMSGWDLVGDGGVQSTAEDLAKWDDEFESGRVGGRALVDLLVAPEHLSTGARVPYGFGLFVDTYGGRRRVWHNGIWAGYRSLFMRFPDAHLTI